MPPIAGGLELLPARPSTTPTLRDPLSVGAEQSLQAPVLPNLYQIPKLLTPVVQNHRIWIHRPGVTPIFIDGHGRGREVGIAKSADGNGPKALQPGDLPVHRRAAVGTEVEGNGLPGIAGAPKNLGLPLQANLFPRPARLSAENTAGALLTLQAMTNGSPDGLPGAVGLQLAASAGCNHGGRGSGLEGMPPLGRKPSE